MAAQEPARARTTFTSPASRKFLVVILFRGRQRVRGYYAILTELPRCCSRLLGKAQESGRIDTRNLLGTGLRF